MTDPIRDQAESIAELLPRLMRRLSAADDATIEMHVGQIRVCGILQDGPRTMSALSKELGISLSAVTQIADRLEKSELVERICECDDRRVKSLQLTARGDNVMRARANRRVERLTEALKRLPPEIRHNAISGLRQILEAAGVEEADPAVLSTTQ